MTISVQSTFHPTYGSLPIDSMCSNLGTCPLFLDLVIYLFVWLADLKIRKKKVIFPFLSFLFWTC